MNMKSSGVWLRPLIGRGFKPWRGLIQGVQTIVLTLVDLTPMWLSSSDTRRLNLQQEHSLETMVYKKWPEPVLPGEWGKPPSSPKNLGSSPRMGKHLLYMQTHNVSLQEKEGPTPGANKIVLKKFFDKSGKRHNWQCRLWRLSLMTFVAYCVFRCWEINLVRSKNVNISATKKDIKTFSTVLYSWRQMGKTLPK